MSFAQNFELNYIDGYDSDELIYMHVSNGVIEFFIQKLCIALKVNALKMNVNTCHNNDLYYFQ